MLVIVHGHRQRRARGGVLLQFRDLPLQLGEPSFDPLELGLGIDVRLRLRSAGFSLVGGLRPLLQGLLLRLELLLLLHQVVEGLLVRQEGLVGGLAARSERMQVPAREVAPIEQVAVDRLGARQDARQGVVVAGGDRVELVVVAPGAADRQPEEGLADRVELLVDHVDQQLLLVGRADHLGPDDEEPGRHDVVVPLLLGAEGEQVAGELLGEEPVERLVGVERGDHVVAIAPGVVVGEVLVRAVGVGVTRDVEPVTAPALAEFGAGQERIDDPRERVGSVVREERLDLGRGRREADQVEEDAPQQVGLSASATGVSPSASSLARMNRSTSERGQASSFTRGTGGSAIGRNAQCERPASRSARAGLVGRGIGSRVGRSHPDPSLQHGDLGFGQLPLGRHLERFDSESPRSAGSRPARRARSPDRCRPPSSIRRGCRDAGPP